MKTTNNENEFTLYSWVNLFILAALTSVLSACGGGGSTDPDPGSDEQPIAYVMRPTPLDNNDNLIESDLQDPIEFRPGAHLIVKQVATLSSSEIDVTDAIIGDTGDVRDPEFNYNGTKLVFSLMMEDDNMGPDETWDIYEYDLTLPLSQTPGSENPRRVMNAFAAVSGHDIGPSYLPGDRIIFSSTRALRTGSVLADEGGGAFRPTIEETDSDILALNLHSMDAADGANLQQLTFNMSHDLDPIMVRNIPGLEWHVMFTRWENSGARNQMSLYAMRPDGTDVIHLYGAHSTNLGTGNTASQFYQPHETSSGDVLVLSRAFNNTQDGGDPVIIDVTGYVDNTVATNANPGGTGPGQTSVSSGQVSTDNTLSLIGRYGSVVPFLDGTNRAVVSYSTCGIDITDPVLMTVEVAVPCSDPRIDLNDPNQAIAAPRYGIWVLDLGGFSNTPVTVAQTGFYFTDVAVGQGYSSPGTQLSYTYDIANTPKIGTLHIHSVYDQDGVFNGLGSTETLATLSNPANNVVRPARFLRIEKGVFLPDDDTRDIDNAAFGLDPRGRLMRFIVGYAPIEPDGSVRVNVPSDIPLSFSVLDENGRRISQRHDNWVTVRPGEEVTCHGCHDHGSGSPHGRQLATASQINANAPALVADGDPTQTMAYIRTEVEGLTPSLDIVYTDYWGTAQPNFSFSFNTVNTTLPINQDIACVINWNENCRTIIDYPTHIQPIWEYGRLDSGSVNRTCTLCHTTNDGANPMVPLGKYQLDLTQNSPDAGGNSIDTQNADYFKSYIELLGPDNQLEVQGAALVDELFNDGQVDGNGNPIMTPRSVFRGTGLVEIITSGNANANQNADGYGPFFEIFSREYYDANVGAIDPMDPAAPVPHWDPGANGGAGGAWLTTGELKLISEWIDIGAQYYNNPLVAPTN